MRKGPLIPKDYKNFRQSAVMILLDTEGRLILTKRSRNVKSHKGQFSFPGGKFEAKDGNLLETALRETEEEIGILRESIRSIVKLSPSYSPRGFLIQPFLGYLDRKVSFVKSRDEVERIVRVPLRFFRSTKPVFRIYKIKGIRVRADFYHFGPHLIWGATARMISLLKNHHSL